MNTEKYQNGESSTHKKQRHPFRRRSFNEIDRVMQLINDTASLSEARRQAEKEGIKLSITTIIRWNRLYNHDYNSKTGIWGENAGLTSCLGNGDALSPGLLNIYLNNEYKCIIKFGDCIPPELYEKTPCMIRVESIKLE